MSTAKRLIKRALLVSLATMGYVLLLPLVRRLRQRSGREAFRILRYHSVSASRPHETNVRPDVFESQMALLARTCRVKPLNEALASVTSEPGLPDNTAVITFDDGYADNFHTALPILERHGLTATCFVSVAYAGTRQRLAHDAHSSLDDARLLSWDEMRAMMARGFTIGSHALSHSRLAGIDEASLRSEVHDSKARLESELGSPVQLMSLPYGRTGDYNAQVLVEAGSAGYTAVATAKYGWNSINTNVFELRRIGVESSDTPFTFRAKLNGALDLLLIFESGPVRKMIGFFHHLCGE